MGIYRTYFTKDNTLIKNKYINTGQNPVPELFYGTNNLLISRYIFDFDLTEVSNRISDFRIPNNGSIKHTLNLTNTIVYDKTFTGNIFYKDHASSFDLVLFKVPQYWDEGIGYDFDYNNKIIDIGGKLYETSSNWFQTTDITNWNEPGIYSGITSSAYTQLATIHFDLGNEDIDLDITDLISGLITSGSTDFYGLGLAYSEVYENIISDFLYSVSFFGKDTNSFFKPFIETSWEDTINDDRKDFYFDKVNKLYLYTNINKRPQNLDNLPSSVTINDYNDDTILVIPSSGITQESKGVYSVSFELSSQDYPDINLVNFTDTWNGLVMNSKVLSPVQLSFTVKENQYYNIGNEVYEPDNFSFTFTGLKRSEKINLGEIRKVIVNVKEMYGYDELIVDGIYYRLYVKQGSNQIEIIPNTKINKAFNQNYFYFDTNWLIPQEYFLELIVDSNGTLTKKDEINFLIIDSKTSAINFII